MNKNKCPSCHEINNENSKYCEFCGTKLEKIKEEKAQAIKLEKEKPLKSNNKTKPILVAVFLTVIVCILLVGSFYVFYVKNRIVATTKLEKDVTVTDKGIADAVEKVYDATVVIENYHNEKLYATGTGFIYQKDNNYGYILTNYHVIQNATNLKVVLSNDKSIEADVVGSDEYADVAVLKIKANEVISVAELGSSENMRVGDTTFVVGAPVDSSIYSWTVTRGILSGKNRVVEISSSTSGYVMEVLQTDAAINSGNSGGPLCNSNGEVIGIVNMKIASTSIEGMGFAIPIEKATEYAEAFVNGKTVSRPYLGISIYDARENFFSTATEVYIDTVESSSSAAKAGLKSGDKITKINDKEITSTSYFKYELYKYNIGDKITITYERNNKEYTAKITLASSSKIS